MRKACDYQTSYDDSLLYLAAVYCDYSLFETPLFTWIALDLLFFLWDGIGKVAVSKTRWKLFGNTIITK
jgi:multidrug transporter EmrE-like cation transporter